MATCVREDCRRTSRFARRIEGVTIDGSWFCSIECVEGFARERLLHVPLGVPAPPRGPEPFRVRLGGWLRHARVIDAAQLDRALDAQSRSGLRLGAQMIALDLASPDDIARALAQQAGVRCLTRVDVAAVRRAPAGLSRSVVRALGVVPFCEPVDGRIRVACTAPVPRVALSALQAITGFVPEPYVVIDDLARDLIAAYGQDIEDTDALHTTIADAAASIARAAASQHGARLTETRWHPYTWVRVADPSGTHDVVLTAPRGQ